MLLLVAIVLQSCLLNDVATLSRVEFIDLSRMKPTRQITTAGRRVSSNPVSVHPSCSKTTKVRGAWWQVNLGHDYVIAGVSITNARRVKRTSE